MMNGTAINVNDLNFTYPDGTKVLNGINLNIKKGESVAIVGPNGAGKSTFLLHLNGILMANSGDVEIFGTRIAKDTLKKVRQKVGIVFQNPDDQLFCPTVYEDIAFGPLNMKLSHEEIDERVHDALTLLNIEELKDKSAHHLSFGQRKRVAIATVLSMRSDILVFDEPSSNLDPMTKRKLITAINDLDATKLIVTQDLFMAAEICDRAVIINKGVVIKDAGIKKILSDEELLEENNLEFISRCKVCKRDASVDAL
jgi:cobalt/nickel transport system ATP-binding protein